MACQNGHLAIVHYLVSLKEQFPNIDPIAKNNDAIRSASQNGHLAVVQYLVSLKKQFPKMDPSAEDNFAIRWASENGHLAVVQYLVSIKEQFPNIDPSAVNNYAIRWASMYGYLEIVQYLVSIKEQFPNIDPSDYNNDAIRWASVNGHLAVVQYLVSIKEQFPKMDPSDENNEAIRMASKNGHVEVVQYLLPFVIYSLSDTKLIKIKNRYPTQIDWNNFDQLLQFKSKIECIKNVISSIRKNKIKLSNNRITTDWQEITRLCGTDEVTTLRRYAEELNIKYEYTNNVLKEKRIIALLLAKDMENYMKTKIERIKKNKEIRGECKEEYTLSGESIYEISDERYIKDKETNYAYDLDEIDQLKNRNPYTRVKFSKEFEEEIKRKKEKRTNEKEKRDEIHEMKRRLTQLEEIKESIINRWSRIQTDDPNVTVYLTIIDFENKTIEELKRLIKRINEYIKIEEIIEIIEIIEIPERKKYGKYKMINEIFKVIERRVEYIPILQIAYEETFLVS
jgi:ankyrin repeat protein